MSMGATKAYIVDHCRKRGLPDPEFLRVSTVQNTLPLPPDQHTMVVKIGDEGFTLPVLQLLPEDQGERRNERAVQENEQRRKAMLSMVEDALAKVAGVS